MGSKRSTNMSVTDWGESPPVPSNETMDEILKIEDGVESVLSKGERSPSSSFMTRMPPVENHVGIRRK